MNNEIEIENFTIQITNVSKRIKNDGKEIRYKGKIIAYYNSNRKEANIDVNKAEIDVFLNDIENSNKSNYEIAQIYKKFGKMLFDILFNDKVIYVEFFIKYKPFLYENSNGNTKDHFRITLEIDDAYFQSLPWELMYDGKNFVNLFNKVDIIRKPSNLGGLLPKQISNNKLKVLIILSNPRGTVTLPYAQDEKMAIMKVINDRFKNTEQLQAQIDILSTDLRDERREIKYEDMPKIEVRELGKPILEKIRSMLDETSYNIIHYIGHSEFDTSNNIGIITLCTNAGNLREIQDEDFAGIFNKDRTSTLGLILLDSCEGGFSSDFNGLAMKIIQRGTIPCVIAMQFKIADRAGHPFASKFYNSFIPSFKPEDGVTSGRETLFFDEFGYTPEFISPVLYLVTDRDIIFNASTAPKFNKLSSLGIDLIKEKETTDFTKDYKRKEFWEKLKRFHDEADKLKDSYQIKNLVDSLRETINHLTTNFANLNSLTSLNQNNSTLLSTILSNFDEYVEIVKEINKKVDMY